MHREVITDIKVVYYRGRYWTGTAWSKTGMTCAAENPAITEVESIAEDRTLDGHPKVGRRLRAVPQRTT
jgi:hypothetical protein